LWWRRGKNVIILPGPWRMVLTVCRRESVDPLARQKLVHSLFLKCCTRRCTPCPAGRPIHHRDWSEDTWKLWVSSSGYSILPLLYLYRTQSLSVKPCKFIDYHLQRVHNKLYCINASNIRPFVLFEFGPIFFYTYIEVRTTLHDSGLLKNK